MTQPSTDDQPINLPSDDKRDQPSKLIDQHADKYNDPRVQITRRGIWMGVAVVVVAAMTAGLSIYARKTPIVETTKFWGVETITALQLAERIELLPRGSEDFPSVELTTTPGLGHLRRALLDERNFDWDRIETKSVESGFKIAEETAKESDDDSPDSVQLRLTDPTGNRVGTIEIDIDLVGGWVGPSDGGQRVKVKEYVQPKLRNYFKTVVHFKQRRYDDRD